MMTIENFNEFLTAFKYIISILAAIGIVVDITPIVKINPIKNLLHWVGTYINKDIKNEINILKSKVDTLEATTDEKEVRRLRTSIFDFANSCRNNRRHTKDEFENIIRDYEDYMKLIDKRGLTNGFLEKEYDYILEIFHECQIKNSFL